MQSEVQYKDTMITVLVRFAVRQGRKHILSVLHKRQEIRHLINAAGKGVILTDAEKFMKSYGVYHD